MDKWLVDVPVCIYVWTRPHILERTFEAIKKARPSVLFLTSDGPRNDEERRLIEESRHIVEQIDWTCDVHKLYMDHNQGMYAMGRKAKDFVFSIVDRCIFLEDDHLASISFFRFCAELLEKYKDDLRISAINGTNYKGIYDVHGTDYFFTLGSCVSGSAIWKRTYDKFYNESVFQDAVLRQELDQYVKYNPKDKLAARVRQTTLGYVKNPYYGNHPPGVEFYRSFINVVESQLDIVPSKNMITNLGSNGTHVGNIKLMPKRRQKLFDQERYELEFPLKHPRYIIRDMGYEEVESALDRICIKAEYLIKAIIYLSPKEFWKKVFNKLKKKHKQEVER